MGKVTLNRIGRNIKNARRNLGFSQEKLAEMCNLSRNSISLLENGKLNSPILTFEKIADALDIKLTDMTNFGK